MTTVPTAQDPQLAAAIQLGWRVAELYARVDDPGETIGDTLLPSHGSLEPADQLELQLRAAAGDARRAGVTSKPAKLEDLVVHARSAPASSDAGEAFRLKLRHCHVEVQKDLWALDECLGKAYELGNGLSDTYGRICRAYRSEDEDKRKTWRDVFDPERVERLKKLLDDLQSRLNAGSVAVVHAQLANWSRKVPDRVSAGELPSAERVRDGLRRQTIIWRQLLTGDKQPEAYLDREARSELRDELRHLIWRRYRRWVIPIGVVLFAVVLALPQLTKVYETGIVKTGLASAVLAGAAALGITKASVLLTVRGRLDEWSRLLWNRAVAQKVMEATLSIDSVFPPVPPERKLRIGVASDVAKRLRGTVVATEPSGSS